MLALADTVVAATRDTFTLRVKPMPPNDTLQREPSAAVARRLTGWKQRVSLSVGMNETVPCLRTTIKSTNGASQ